MKSVNRLYLSFSVTFVIFALSPNFTLATANATFIKIEANVREKLSFS
jgi:hypothetical protein